jgi:putative ABC transport system permease protein
MQSLWQDLKFAARMLRKNPSFTLVAVLTLALGIGANTAIFSVVNAVLLQPLPYANASRLVSIAQTDRQSQTNGIPFSYPKFSQIHEQSHTLENAAAYFPRNLALAGNREPEVVSGALVSEDFFRVLGVTPVRGRDFSPNEEDPGGPNVAVISNGFWHSHFGGNEGLLGQNLNLDGKSVTVIGILPATFQFPLQFPAPDVWVPRVFEVSVLKPEQVRAGAGYLSVIGKLLQGQTLAQAQAELDTINGRYREQFASNADASRYELSVTSLEESVVSGLRASLLALLAAVGFVLLIACANVANLLLARATAREREIAIRKALGASRSRLVRQLLIESLLLSFGGGFTGVCLSALLLPALRMLSPGTVPRLGDARIDGSVLLFSIALCVVTGIVFGIVPALQGAQKGLQSTLKEGGRGASDGSSRGRFRGLLVVAEVGFALVLMTGAGLLIDSFARLMQVNPGLVPKGLMTFPISLPSSRYSQPERQAEFYRELLDKVRTIPGVQSAGATSYLPLSGGVRFVFFCAEGRTCLGIGKDPLIAMRQVSPEYFDTARTPLLRGRVFSAQDVAGSLPVAIVNETTAKRFWPDQNAIGKHLANSRDMIQREIVGVVADVKFNGLNAANSEEMYLPLAQNPWPSVTLVVRSAGSPQPLVAAVRAKISELDASLPVSGILSMEDVVATSVAQPRLITQFAGVFAGFALLLAAVGIYGVMAYSVTLRSQEMGIRVALGAGPSDILKLVVGQGMWLTVAGVVAGVVASLMLTRLLSSLLFGVHAVDVTVFGGAALVLVGAAFVACYLPARRATQVDPIVVLRFE